MHTITPIGSCRITHPLRLYAESNGLEMNMNRVFGYMHTSAEAVQQMRFFDGSFTPSKTAWPLICRKFTLENLTEEQHEKSDVYLVEISSAKEWRLGDTFIQLNYLRHHFSEFFDDPNRRTKYTRLCQRSEHDELDEFLDENWSVTTDQKEQSKILRELTFTTADSAKIARDLETLKNALGNVVVVTHVNATNADDEVIQSRAQTIADVEAAAHRVDVPVFNPTALMREAGQENALDDARGSMTHYTDDFCQTVFNALYADFIAPILGRKS